jgi:hypothetical protein
VQTLQLWTRTAGVSRDFGLLLLRLGKRKPKSHQRFAKTACLAADLCCSC